MTVLLHSWAALIVFEVFDCPGTNDKVVAVTDDINFGVLPSKTSQVHSNDKPWLSRELKKPIFQKRNTHRSQDDHIRGELQRQIKREMVPDKLNYELKLEAPPTSRNSREACRDLKRWQV